MTPERYERLSEMFSELCELPLEQRASQLQIIKTQEPELANQLRVMILHDGQMDTAMLDIHVKDKALEHLITHVNRPVNVKLPKQIGPFRIIRVLGTGAMGIVYEAEQETPRRRVALKAFRPHLTTEPLLKRFELECEILGHLRHPGIAQIYEAGSLDTEFGVQPYFAMELIEGESIVRFAQECDMSVKERLRLMIMTCRAVHYAHQRGVIHRDLKPDNILVVDDTEGPRPKILDFGVARATDADIRTTTLHTEAGLLLGTVAYMSPEQALGNPNDIDVRSDVYALGIILFELLSNDLPHKLEGLMMLEALRVIREDEPTRLASVVRNYHGDLDTIIAKTIEKDKDRRYQSVAELADDLQRHLDDKPIQARPPSTSYQMKKFALRNKALVGGIVTAILLLVLGIAGTSYGLVLADRRLGDMKIARDNAEALLTYYQGLMESVSPERFGRDMLVIELLDETAETLEDKLGDWPIDLAEMHHVIGRTYLKLGQLPKGGSHLDRALELQQDLLGPDHASTLATRIDRCGLLMRRYKNEEAETELNAILKALDPHHESYEEMWDAARYLLANVYNQQRRGEEAYPILMELLEKRERRLGPEHRETLLARYSVAFALGRQGHIEECIEEFLELEQIQRRVLDKHHADRLMTLNALGTTNYMICRYDESVHWYELAIEGRVITLGETASLTRGSRTFLAGLLVELGRIDEAIRIYELVQVADIKLKGSAADDRASLQIESRIGHAHALSGQYERAEQELVSVLERQQAILERDDSTLIYTNWYLADLAMLQGRHAEAVAPFERALQLVGKHPPGNKRIVPLIRNLEARIRTAQGRYEEAESLFRSCLRDTRAGVRSLDHPDIGWHLEGLGACLTAMGRYDEALTTLEEARRLLTKAWGPNHPRSTQCLESLIELDEAWEKPEKADAFQEELQGILTLASTR
ncbi:MAG: serine/threonine-protein kinase [Planctomycetota bacterium]|nr:serine/threonine-protein kinase [Planctomycetota bacterium]